MLAFSFSERQGVIKREKKNGNKLVMNKTGLFSHAENKPVFVDDLNILRTNCTCVFNGVSI